LIQMQNGSAVADDIIFRTGIVQFNGAPAS
jgi:hypothetical protein